MMIDRPLSEEDVGTLGFHDLSELVEVRGIKDGVAVDLSREGGARLQDLRLIEEVETLPTKFQSCRFPIKRRREAEFLPESNLGLPDLYTDSSTAGLITSAQTPMRRMQFGLRLLW